MASHGYLQLLSLLPRHPGEFLDQLLLRLELKWEGLRHPRPSYRAKPWPEVMRDLAGRLGPGVEDALAEAELEAIEAEVQRGLGQLDGSPLPGIHNGDFVLARLCYAMCRAVRPEIVVETGVAHGVSSSFILAALERNGAGRLHSIDKLHHEPGAAAFVGRLVPERLRPRWELHVGRSMDVLPGLLARVPPVGLFLHDSRHTYSNMRAEFLAALPRLASRAAVLFDDAHRNAAFAEVEAHPRCRYAAVMSEETKHGLCGVALFDAPGRGAAESAR